MLISTGQRHFGRFIVQDVMDRYLRGDPENHSAFRTIVELNGQMVQNVQNGDLPLFAAAVNAHSDALVRLSPLIYGKELLALREKCLAYTDACCICGAGGGGYLFGLLREGVTPAQMQDEIKHCVFHAGIV